MVRLMEQAHRRGVELVVFPELALTTFFPRHYHEDIAEADGWFESAMPSNETAPLFAAAKKYRIGFHLGYAERVTEPDASGTLRTRRFNTAILVNPDGVVLLKYRKVHLPGHAEYDPIRKVQHLEKRYFEVGNLGFPVIRAPMGAGRRDQHGHDDLQRSPLAGGLARARPAERRAGAAGVQHAEPEQRGARLRGAPSAGFPQPSVGAGWRLPERLLRGRHREGRHRGRA